MTPTSPSERTVTVRPETAHRAGVKPTVCRTRLRRVEMRDEGSRFVAVEIGTGKPHVCLVSP